MVEQPPDEFELDAVFGDVLGAAAQLDDIDDLARTEAWASSVLGVWAESLDAAAIDAEFVEWLRRSEDPAAPHVLNAVSRLLDGPNQVAVPLRAWEVSQHEALSVGIGFLLEDGSQYSLLGDLDAGELTSLIVAPGPAELFDDAEDLVDPAPVDVIDAARKLVEGWRALHDGGADLPESVYVNGALGARRLGEVVGADLSALYRPEGDGATVTATSGLDDLSTEEQAELNAWALSVLDGAGVGQGQPAPELLTHPLLPAQIRTYPAAEREAFSALEWADWLGVILQSHRAHVGAIVDPTTLVDFVNKCPEVTSTIPKKDRPYYEWAFSLVLPLWREAGVIDDHNALSPNGAAMLVGAARKAWAR